MLAGCKLASSAWAPQHNACAKAVGHTSDTLCCDAHAGVASLCNFLILFPHLLIIFALLSLWIKAAKVENKSYYKKYNFCVSNLWNQFCVNDQCNPLRYGLMENYGFYYGFHYSLMCSFSAVKLKNK